MVKIDKRKSIGEVAKELDLPVHVIRFWEEQFPQIRPVIGKGRRRYFFDKHIEIIKKVKHYLYDEGYTIKGLKKLLKENGDIVKKARSSSSSKDTESKSSKMNTKQIKSLKIVSSELQGVVDEFKKYLQRLC